jgi:pyridoxamine 5'-phosphate oxidase family protein
MTFTPRELDYLRSQRFGRLATAHPDGTLHVNPVGFRFNPDTETIDIVGFHMARTRKFRNVADNGRVAFVVDDVPSVQPLRVRYVEIRGRAEAIEAPADAPVGRVDGAIIRIHPHRVVSLGLDDPDQDVHELKPRGRTVTDPARPRSGT